MENTIILTHPEYGTVSFSRQTTRQRQVLNNYNTLLEEKRKLKAKLEKK